MKQFVLSNSAGAMKVGTDGVTLGAWVDIPRGCRRVLDAGTGTGLIALMLAQRCPEAVIDAIEIDPVAAAEACGNVAASPWSDRVRVHEADFADWTEGGYDLVVSNPPFFTEPLRSPDSARARARHEGSLSAKALVERSGLLAPEGRLAVILPTDADTNMEWLAALHRLNILRRIALAGAAGKQPVRTLWELSPSATGTGHVPDRSHIHAPDRLDIRGADGRYTPEYQRIVSPFYL